MATTTTPTAHTEYKLMADGTIQFERLQVNTVARETHDTFGPLWGVAFADVPQDCISLISEGKSRPIIGSKLLLSPPYSITRWALHKPFTLRWNALIFDRPYPDQWPKFAQLYEITAKDQPKEFQTLKMLLATLSSGLTVEAQEDHNPISRKLKRSIDQNFRAEIKISHFAREFGVHPDVMARYFKKTYGLTPLEYRNQLRLFLSLWTLMSQKQTVVDIAGGNGFNSLRNFYTQFRRYTSLLPGQIRFYGKEKLPNDPDAAQD